MQVLAGAYYSVKSRIAHDRYIKTFSELLEEGWVYAQLNEKYQIIDFLKELYYDGTFVKISDIIISIDSSKKQIGILEKFDFEVYGSDAAHRILNGEVKK